MVFYGILWYFMVWYGMVWYGMIWSNLRQHPSDATVKIHQNPTCFDCFREELKLWLGWGDHSNNLA